MDMHRYSAARHICLLISLAVSAFAPLAQGQTKSAENKSAITADQQKQLDRLQQLTNQMAKDRDAVSSAVAQYGWDSNEADTAQQHLLQDRQEYRSVRRSLENEGVSLPTSAWGSTGGNCCDHDGQHCCDHDHGSHDCCSGAGHCGGHHHGCCGDHGS
jgi:hypothetical protein